MALSGWFVGFVIWCSRYSYSYRALPASQANLSEEIRRKFGMRKEFNSHKIGLGHQRGRRFIVLGPQYGCREDMYKTKSTEAHLRFSMQSLRYVFERVCFIIYYHERMNLVHGASTMFMYCLRKIYRHVTEKLPVLCRVIHQAIFVILSIG